MNSLYYGVLWTLLLFIIYLFIYFLINFIIYAEMTSFSLDDEE